MIICKCITLHRVTVYHVVWCCCISLSVLLPVEVRCYMFVQRRLTRIARCDTMSHLTADAVRFRTSLARNARCNTMSHLTAAGCRRSRAKSKEQRTRLRKWPPRGRYQTLPHQRLVLASPRGCSIHNLFYLLDWWDLY